MCLCVCVSLYDDQIALEFAICYDQVKDMLMRGPLYMMDVQDVMKIVRFYYSNVAERFSTKTFLDSLLSRGEVGTCRAVL